MEISEYKYRVGGKEVSFIRAKEIPPRSGNWYDYEVETHHEGGHVRQKVIRYIGKSSLRASRSTIFGREGYQKALKT